MTEEITRPTYTWYPLNDPVITAAVETRWSVDIFLDVQNDPNAIETVSVTDYEYEWAGDVLDGVEIEKDINGVHVEGKNVTSDLFPAKDIEYQVMGGDKPPWRITKHAERFADLPKPVNEMIRYLPSDSKSKTFVIHVTAILSTGTRMSAGFSIVIEADYTPGKLSLKDAVNASRSQER